MGRLALTGRGVLRIGTRWRLSGRLHHRVSGNGVLLALSEIAFYDAKGPIIATTNEGASPVGPCRGSRRAFCAPELRNGRVGSLWGDRSVPARIGNAIAAPPGFIERTIQQREHSVASFVTATPESLAILRLGFTQWLHCWFWKP